MVNQEITPSSSCVDSFVKGLVKKGDAYNAHEKVTDLFNAYGVIPDKSSLDLLLQVAMENKDTYEEQRVRDTIQKMQ